MRRSAGRGPARDDRLQHFLDRQGRQDLLLQRRCRQEILSGKAGRESAKRARLHGRQQRRVHREGHARLLRLRRRGPGQGSDRRQTQGEQRHLPHRRSAQRRAFEIELRRCRLHPHHRRLRLLSRREIPRFAERTEKIPHRFLGHAAGRQAAGAGNPHLQGPAHGGRQMDHHGAPAHSLVVDTRLRTPRPSGHQARLGSDVGRRAERHAGELRRTMACSSSRTTRPARN